MMVHKFRPWYRERVIHFSKRSVIVATLLLILGLGAATPADAKWYGGEIQASGQSVRIYKCWPAKTDCSHVLHRGESSKHWTSDADGFQVPSGKVAIMEGCAGQTQRRLGPGKHKVLDGTCKDVYLRNA